MRFASEAFVGSAARGWSVAERARTINVNAGIDRDMERYLGVNFEKTRLNVGGGVNTSRKISFGGFVSMGDQVRYVTDPFLGDGSNISLFTTPICPNLHAVNKTVFL